MPAITSLVDQDMACFFHSKKRVTQTPQIPAALQNYNKPLRVCCRTFSHLPSGNLLWKRDEKGPFADDFK